MPASETPAFADPLAGATETPEHTGAFWMPFTANRQFKKTPRLLASAEGMYYTDVDGRQVLDGRPEFGQQRQPLHVAFMVTRVIDGRAAVLALDRHRRSRIFRLLVPGPCA